MQRLPIETCQLANLYPQKNNNGGTTWKVTIQIMGKAFPVTVSEGMDTDSLPLGVLGRSMCEWKEEDGIFRFTNKDTKETREYTKTGLFPVKLVGFEPQKKA